MENKDILNLKINDDDFDDDLTIKGYLKSLLVMVWKEGECFNGNRPFGNSGWEYNLYEPLVEADVVGGWIDEDGFIGGVDKPANKVILELIDHLFDS